MKNFLKSKFKTFLDFFKQIYKNFKILKWNKMNWKRIKKLEVPKTCKTCETGAPTKAKDYNNFKHMAKTNFTNQKQFIKAKIFSHSSYSWKS